MASAAPAVADGAAAFADEKVQWQAQGRQQIFNVTTCSNAALVRQKDRAKRKDDSLSGMLCAAIVQHQLGLSINLILLLAFTHTLFPSLRSRTTHFFCLSYYDPNTGLYNQGWDDLKFVSFCIVAFTGLRAATMDYLFVPLARKAGITKKKTMIRFAEQAWLLVYVSVFWSLGMYLMQQTPYFFNLRAVWSNFPTRSMTGLFKCYYLIQFAFWLQQIVVVHIEERRKDHWQMFTHHIITCALILTSYGYYQTKVGSVVLCLMDTVDLVFPTAKLLKYAGYQTLCDMAFVLFIITWFITRHVFYLAVCWSIYTEMPVEMPYGCYNAVTGEKTSDDGGTAVLSNMLFAYTNTSTDVCYNERIHYGFLALLLALQFITIIWFGMICRVAYRVVTGKGADDSRSDDEGEEEEEEDEGEERDAEKEDAEDAIERVRDFAEKEPELSLLNNNHQQYQEEDVGVEELRFSKRAVPPPHRKKSQSGGGGGGRRGKSRASGISIPGHGDHKELLGRIGCDKPT